MTTEQYIQQVAEIDEQIKALQAEKEYVEGEYFTTNAKYHIGDRLIATRNGKYEKNDVMITGYSTKWKDITYTGKKIKKDGTVSSVNCWFLEYRDTFLELKERGYGQRMGYVKDGILVNQ